MATSDMSCGKVPDLFGYIPGICNYATKEFSRGRCVRSKKQQAPPEMLNYQKGNTNFTNEGSFSAHSNLNLHVTHTKECN